MGAAAATCGAAGAAAATLANPTRSATAAYAARAASSMLGTLALVSHGRCGGVMDTTGPTGAVRTVMCRLSSSGNTTRSDVPSAISPRCKVIVTSSKIVASSTSPGGTASLRISSLQVLTARARCCSCAAQLSCGVLCWQPHAQTATSLTQCTTSCNKSAERRSVRRMACRGLGTMRLVPRPRQVTWHAATPA